MNARTDGGTIKSDKTLLAILDELQHRNGVGVTELSGELDVSKSTIHKHLKTLEQHGYVENDEGMYQLGMRFLTLGGLARNRNRLCFAAKEWAERLATETNEMTTFAMEHGGVGLWIYFYNDYYDMRTEIHVGGTFKLHQLAVGKAILSRLPDERVEAILEDAELEGRTDKTVTDRETLLDQLQHANDHGFAQSAGEFRDGALSIAAPVHDPRTGHTGALGLAGPSTEIAKQKLIDEHSDELLKTANRLELQLRFV